MTPASHRAARASILYAATANDHVTAAVLPFSTRQRVDEHDSAVPSPSPPMTAISPPVLRSRTPVPAASDRCRRAGSSRHGWGQQFRMQQREHRHQLSVEPDLCADRRSDRYGVAELQLREHSGTTVTGTVSIPDAAGGAIREHRSNMVPGVSVCTGGATLSGCTSTASGIGNATCGIAFYGSYAYVAEFARRWISAVAGDGTLSGWSSTGSNFTDVTQLTVQGAYLYGANANNPGPVTYCAISPTDGTLSNCAVTAANTATNGTDAIAVGPDYALCRRRKLARCTHRGRRWQPHQLRNDAG